MGTFVFMRQVTRVERQTLNGVEVNAILGIVRIPIRGSIKMVIGVYKIEKYFVVTLAIHDSRNRIVELKESDFTLSGTRGRVDNGILSFRLPPSAKSFVIEAWTT